MLPTRETNRHISACRDLLKTIDGHLNGKKRLKVIILKETSSDQGVVSQLSSPLDRPKSLDVRSTPRKSYLPLIGQKDFLCPDKQRDLNIKRGSSLTRCLVSKSSQASILSRSDIIRDPTISLACSNNTDSINSNAAAGRRLVKLKVLALPVLVTPPWQKSIQQYLKNPSLEKYFKFCKRRLNEDPRPLELVLSGAKHLRSLHRDQFVELPGVFNQKSTKKQARSKTLVLGLENTLVHCCNFDGPRQEYQTKVFYESQADGGIITAEMNFRPHLSTFLRDASNYFTIVVFSSSEPSYTQAICKSIDPEGLYISKILSRNHCIKTEKGYTVKDLRVVSGDNTSTTVLVDSTVFLFAPQINNGIPILPYVDQKDDVELLRLVPFLKVLAEQPDMPGFLRSYFKMSKVMHCKDELTARQHLLSAVADL